MIYCSIDIETTGLNPKTCDILQFALIIDDLSNPKPLHELPHFQAYFIKDNYIGEPYALSMHPEIFKEIAHAQKHKAERNEFGDRFMNIEHLPTALECFLGHYGLDLDPQTNKCEINVAGKNIAAFDLPFLRKKIKNWGSISFKNRVLDPAILYYEKGDKILPDMKLCMERAGIIGEVAHTALEDAMMVVRLIRNKLL